MEHPGPHRPVRGRPRDGAVPRDERLGRSHCTGDRIHRPLGACGHARRRRTVRGPAAHLAREEGPAVITRYLNGRVFTADPDREKAFAEAFAIQDESIVFVGDSADAPEADSTVDLGGRFVLPGFTDAHTHLLMMGAALGQVHLTDARSLDEIQARLRQARAENPDAAVLRGRGWLFDSLPEAPTSAMIDAAVPDIPVYLDANDYHSCWVNSAALAELGITADTPDPLGGEIARDAEGRPTGMLYETAATQYAWAHRDATTTDDDRDADVQRALDAYLASGVTGVVDMAFDEFGLAAFERARVRHGGELPLRVSAHWIVNNTG